MTLEEKQIFFRVAQWIDDHRKMIKTIRQLAETEENYLIIRRELDRVEGQRTEARKRGADASLTLVEWFVTLEHFHWQCAYCQARAFQVMSHIIPLPQGGTVRGNCIPACYKCRNIYNYKKSTNPHVQLQT